MKKLNYLLLGAAGLLLASCSQEAGNPDLVKNEDLVTFTVQLPDYLATRAATGTQLSAFGTGYYANKLTVAAYDAGELMDQGTFTFPNNSLSMNVSLHLAKGKEYQVVFFAQSESSVTNNVYSLNMNAGTMTVNYPNMTSVGNLADAYDCFYASWEGEPYNDAMNATTVELYRIVAQINWGTDDLDTNAAHEAYYGEQGQYINSALELDAYTQFNLLTGGVTGQPISVKLQEFGAPYNLAFPAQEPVVPGMDPKYTYIAMQYVLAPKNGADFDLSLTINNNGNTSVDAAVINKVVEVANVPLQANYQTNIYGTLLTGNLDVTVTKHPGWNGSFEVDDVDGDIDITLPGAGN